MRRRLGTGLLALLAAASVAVPASAAGGSGSIVDIRSKGQQLKVVFTAPDLAAGTSLDPGSVSVTIDGQQVQATARRASEEAAAVDRSSLLLIDTSGSMTQNKRIDAAKQAALSYLAAVPADVKVGLETFDTKPAVVVPPTTDRGRLRTAVSALAANPKGSTALYDAVSQGVQTLGKNGVRSILLLTDGVDEGSRTALPAAAAAVKASGATLDAVGVDAGANAGALTTLAQAGNGTVLTKVDPQRLTAAFQQSAQTIANQLLVVATVPVELSGRSGTVTVSATADGGTYSDDAFVPFDTFTVAGAPQYAPKAVVVPSQPLLGRWTVPVAVGAVFLGAAVVLLVAGGALVRATNPASRMTRRLSVYTLNGRQPRKQEEVSTLGSSTVARSAVELANRVVESRDLETRVAARLDAAQVPLRPAEWLLLHVGVSVGSGFLLLLLTGGRFLPMVVGVILGGAGAWLYLSFKIARRRSAFLAQMPDTLQLVAGGLSAGYSLPQALDGVVREGSEPMTTELNRALVETRLGVPVEDALESVAGRMQSRDFGWVVMAIRIQREVGGNLGEVLQTVSATLRERERLRRQVKALSAEGRLSAWILGALPVVFALYLLLVRPTYIRPLYTNILGIVMLVMGTGLLAVGAFWMSKIVKVEV